MAGEPNQNQPNQIQKQVEKQIEKIIKDKDLKFEKIEAKEHKDFKIEKVEKNEAKEHKDQKNEKHEKNEFKEHKDAKIEKHEKNELKEHKDHKNEFKEFKIENKEHSKVEFEGKAVPKEKDGKEIVEGPGGDPLGDPLSQGVGGAQHFIQPQERPDLSRGALSGEEDQQNG